MALPFDASAVALPSGDLIAAARVAANDGTVQWEDDHPKLTPPAAVTSPLDAQLAAKREELRRLEEYITDVRRQADSHDDDRTGPERPSAASGPAVRLTSWEVSYGCPNRSGPA